MTDPTTPEGIRFVLAAEAVPLEDDEQEPCVWCNNPQAVAERKHAMAGNDAHAAAEDIPDSEAKCMADYKFVFGHTDGEHATIYACEPCLRGIPVEYGDSTTRDLPFSWRGEVTLNTQVPRLDADMGTVHRNISVAALGDLSIDFPSNE